MLVLIGLCAFAWRFSAWHIKEQNQKTVGEAYIAKDGACVNGKLYAWNFLGSSLSSGKIEEKQGLKLLAVTYTTPTFPGPQINIVRVPIPPDQEEAAKKTIEQLFPK
jgi:hypothetical protein